MKCKFLILFVVAASAALLYAPMASADPILGTATQFAVLGHVGVSNTGPTVIFGSNITHANVGNFEDGANAGNGFSPANTFHGSGTHSDGPGLVLAPSEIHLGDGDASNARDDFWTAYTALASYGTATPLTGILGNGVGGTIPTLGRGVYSFASTAQLNGTLQLDAGGIAGGFWVFQIGTDLTTASASAVQVINAPNGGADVGVFWVLGTNGTAGLGSATLGTTTAFEGNILARTTITLTTGATIYNGRAFAYTGAVTLDTNVISDICPSITELPAEVTSGTIGLAGSSSPNSGPGFSGGLEFVNHEVVPVGSPGPSPVPEPSTMLLLGSGLAGLVAFRKRSKKA